MVKLMPMVIGPSKQFLGHAHCPPLAGWPVMEVRGWRVTLLCWGSATPGWGGWVRGRLPAETLADPKYPALKEQGCGEALECFLVEEAQSGIGPDPSTMGCRQSLGKDLWASPREMQLKMGKALLHSSLGVTSIPALTGL